MRELSVSFVAGWGDGGGWSGRDGFSGAEVDFNSC